MNDLTFCVRASFVLFCFVRSRPPRGFCGNPILKIAPLQRPTAVASCAGGSGSRGGPLLMHDSFIAHYHPTLIPAQGPPLGYLMETVVCWGGGEGGVVTKADVSTL